MKQKWSAAALLALVLVLVFGNVALAQSKTLYWQRFDADITVQLNGDMRVVETQELVFTSGTFRFGQEDIPTNRLNGISDVQVSEENGQVYTETGTDTGQPYTYSVSESDGMLHIRYNFPPSSDSRRTIVIAYTVSGALRYYPENNADQLYWAVIRPNNPFPIQGSTITLHVPEGATFKNYTVYGQPATADFQPGQKDATMVVQGPIQPGTEVDAVGEWQPHGLVAGSPQPWQEQLDAAAAQKAQQQAFQAKWGPVLTLGMGALGILLALGGPLLLYLWWYRKGRDAPVGLIADYLPEPPSDLPPGVAGTLIDESADMQDVLATILDLARRGAMEIEEIEEPGFLGIGGHKDFVYRRKPNNLKLLKYEQMLLDDMFGGRDEVKLSDLKNKFYAEIPALRKELYTEAVRQGLFPESPEATRSRFGCLGIVGLVVAGVVGFILLGSLSQFTSTAICPGLGLGVTAIGLLMLGRYMPRKTEKGADASARWLAFKRYLQNLEKYTNVQEKADIFERYLPYAVAFGLEQELDPQVLRSPGARAHLVDPLRCAGARLVWAAPGRREHSGGWLGVDVRAVALGPCPPRDTEHPRWTTCLVVWAHRSPA